MLNRTVHRYQSLLVFICPKDHAERCGGLSDRGYANPFERLTGSSWILYLPTPVCFLPEGKKKRAGMDGKTVYDNIPLPASPRFSVSYTDMDILSSHSE